MKSPRPSVTRDPMDELEDIMQTLLKNPASETSWETENLR